MVTETKHDSVTNASIVGAASICPQTPVSQLTKECSPVGAEVEVKISSEGFYDSWFEAKVLTRHSVTRYVKYKVQYLSLLRDDGSGEPLVEEVYAKNVRPRAPRRLNLNTSSTSCEDEDPNFKMHDLVEAYHMDGWWHGVVSGLGDPETGLYTVSFPNTREVFQFKPSEIRPKLAFVNGKWVPVLGQELQTKGSYKEGDNVEVSLSRDDYGLSYFPAQVEKVIHNSYYLVKYESPYARPNGNLTEILEPRYLRPAVDCPVTNCFMAGSHVEVFHEGGWSAGVVLSCLSDSDYAVSLESKGEPTTQLFNFSNLRLRLYWNGRKWSKWVSPSKEKKRKSANLSKITPESVTSPGKKLKMERSEENQELQSPLEHKVTPRMDLESEDEVPITELFRLSESSKTNSSSSPKKMRAVRKISQSRKLLTELKDCHSKINTGKRSSTCKRNINLNSWKIDKNKEEVNCKRLATLEKRNDENLSNQSSSDVPQPNTNSEKEAIHVSTISCEQQYACIANYAADYAGEKNTVRVSFDDNTSGHVVISESQCLLNAQDSRSDGVDEINKGQLVNSQLLNSNATMKHPPGSQDKSLNPSRPVVSVDQKTVQPSLGNHTLAQNTPVKSVTSDNALPFDKTSPAWKTLEEHNVFRCIPQTPHFAKLERKCKEKREGKAICMMVIYTNLAESIQMLQTDTEVTVFEAKLACLDSLEENGFIVDPIRSCLQDLLAIKTNKTKSALKQVELETALANKEQEKTSSHASANSYEAELEDIENKLDKLKQSIAELEEKKKVVMKEKAEWEHDISKLREEISSISCSNALCQQEFERVRSRPLTKG